MLTDDDLTRQLEDAFRASATDLAYAGRVPIARRSPSAGWLALPAIATAATLVVTGSTHDGSAPAAPEAGGAPSTSAGPHLVAETITVAGYTFSYRHAAGDSGPADDLYAALDVAAVPDGATPVDGAPSGVQAWVGTDPESGDHALYVKAPTRNGGRLFAVLSPTWTEGQLSQLFLHGDPRPVPAAS